MLTPSLMAPRPTSPRTQKRIERLEQTKLILDQKIKTLQAARAQVKRELLTLTNDSQV